MSKNAGRNRRCHVEPTTPRRPASCSPAYHQPAIHMPLPARQKPARTDYRDGTPQISAERETLLAWARSYSPCSSADKLSMRPKELDLEWLCCEVR